MFSKMFDLLFPHIILLPLVPVCLTNWTYMSNPGSFLIQLLHVLIHVATLTTTLVLMHTNNSPPRSGLLATIYITCILVIIIVAQGKGILYIHSIYCPCKCSCNFYKLFCLSCSLAPVDYSLEAIQMCRAAPRFHSSDTQQFLSEPNTGQCQRPHACHEKHS